MKLPTQREYAIKRLEDALMLLETGRTQQAYNVIRNTLWAVRNKFTDADLLQKRGEAA